MKLNPDCVRAILLEVESCTDFFQDLTYEKEKPMPKLWKPFKTVKLKGYRISLNSTLRYLHEEKYIEYDTVYNAVQVLHSGWYLGQTMMSNFIKFLINSIAVPIIVSIVTTLATLFIQSFFAG